MRGCRALSISDSQIVPSFVQTRPGWNGEVTRTRRSTPRGRLSRERKLISVTLCRKVLPSLSARHPRFRVALLCGRSSTPPCQRVRAINLVREKKTKTNENKATMKKKQKKTLLFFRRPKREWCLFWLRNCTFPFLLFCRRCQSSAVRLRASRQQASLLSCFLKKIKPERGGEKRMG